MATLVAILTKIPDILTPQNQKHIADNHVNHLNNYHNSQ